MSAVRCADSKAVEAVAAVAADVVAAAVGGRNEKNEATCHCLIT